MNIVNNINTKQLTPLELNKFNSLLKRMGKLNRQFDHLNKINTHRGQSKGIIKRLTARAKISKL